MKDKKSVREESERQETRERRAIMSKKENEGERKHRARKDI